MIDLTKRSVDVGIKLGGVKAILEKISEDYDCAHGDNDALRGCDAVDELYNLLFPENDEEKIDYNP